MKIIFACRKSSSSIFIANRLVRHNFLDALIIETGVTARKRKLSRIRNSTQFWEWPAVCLDLTALAIYSTLQDVRMKRFVKEQFDSNEFPKNITRFYTDDINEISCKEFLYQQQPDILVVFGTSILKKDVLAIPKKYTLNIHGGIVPEYRNVHSELWAYVQNDYDKLGTSIIHLDEGVDSGAIAIQSTVVTHADDSIFDVKRKNVELASKLIIELLEKAESGIPRLKQDDRLANYYPTPGMKEFIRLLLVSCVNKVQRFKNRGR